MDLYANVLKAMTPLEWDALIDRAASWTSGNCWLASDVHAANDVAELIVTGGLRAGEG